MAKKNIVILGSTGSVGVSTLDVISNKSDDINIELLVANNNYKKLIEQAKKFKPKKVLIKNEKHFQKVKYGLKNKKIKVYSGNIAINKIIKKKIDYTMSAIVGIAGLKPTLESIKFSKKIAIANKESIICGWPILKKKLKKYNTELVPIDSEHFSIKNLITNHKDDEIEQIIITASGGPFLKSKINTLKNVLPSQAIKHPNWKMGKKISVDSANLVNKVFEVVEASKIFNINSNKYKILIHPQSYVHSIVIFKNGLTKMLMHESDMKIPIAASIFGYKKTFSSKNIKNERLNNLKFQTVNIKQYPAVSILKKILSSGDMAPTLVNAFNEELVSLFLEKKILFTDIAKNLIRLTRQKEFYIYSKIQPKNITDIFEYDKWARLKVKSISV